MTQALPKTQLAVQLTGPDTLKLNTAKPVIEPGPREILGKTEATGLCFSDLKLLKQFDQHARKSDVVKGIDADRLGEVHSYVPGDKPTVPGHEVVLRIIAVGSEVTKFTVGQRVLVQADYRELRTAGSNGAFGYNFEGGLQQYVLCHEDVVTDSKGDKYLLDVSDGKSASALALVEPWACVEDSYVTRERQTILAGGKLLIVAEPGTDTSSVAAAYSPDGEPADVVTITPNQARDQPNEGFDDVVYFGADKAVIDVLNDKLANNAIINVVLGGKTIGQPISLGVGRVHYGMTRWIGTTGDNAADSYKMIPANGELRKGDHILVVGAGGPMGQMHVIRNACSGIANIEMVGTDFDDPRLEALDKKVRSMADANGVKLDLVNTKTNPLDGTFSYFALMAPFGQLVADAIAQADDDAIINIFAGIPAPTKHDIDLDAVIARRAFMFGTSGSTIEDMRIVLNKVESGQLDTNASVDAIAGMAGATDGIRAVENRTMAGKIIVYPTLTDVGLIPLSELGDTFPTVAAKLDEGRWTHEAEQELLAVAS